MLPVILASDEVTSAPTLSVTEPLLTVKSRLSLMTAPADPGPVAIQNVGLRAFPPRTPELNTVFPVTVRALLSPAGGSAIEMEAIPELVEQDVVSEQLAAPDPFWAYTP